MIFCFWEIDFVVSFGEIVIKNRAFEIAYKPQRVDHGLRKFRCSMYRSAGIDGVVPTLFGRMIICRLESSSLRTTAPSGVISEVKNNLKVRQCVC